MLPWCRDMYALLLLYTCFVAPHGYIVFFFFPTLEGRVQRLLAIRHTGLCIIFRSDYHRYFRQLFVGSTRYNRTSGHTRAKRAFIFGATTVVVCFSFCLAKQQSSQPPLPSLSLSFPCVILRLSIRTGIVIFLHYLHSFCLYVYLSRLIFFFFSCFYFLIFVVVTETPAPQEPRTGHVRRP